MFEDPFESVFRRGFYLYIVLLMALLFWPYRFTGFAANQVEWLSDGNGISFSGNGQVISPAPAEILNREIVQGNGFSIECWIRTLDLEQTGPARIVSFSKDPEFRNFTLGQEGRDLIFRLRTSVSDLNGLYPQIKVRDVFSSRDAQHIAVVYHYDLLSIYIDGEVKLRMNYPDGGLDNWDDAYWLVLGNEATGDRPWKGQMFYLAIYNRVLSDAEIQSNFARGYTSPTPTLAGAVCRYDFSEGSGSVINNGIETFTLLNLIMPDRIHTVAKPYLAIGGNGGVDFERFKDLVYNVIVFLPFGFLACAYFANVGKRSVVKAGIWALIVCVATSLVIESIQYGIAERTSSLIDVATNGFGALVGIVLYIAYRQGLEKYRLVVLKD